MAKSKSTPAPVGHKHEDLVREIAALKKEVAALKKELSSAKGGADPRVDKIITALKSYGAGKSIMEKVGL